MGNSLYKRISESKVFLLEVSLYGNFLTFVFFLFFIPFHSAQEVPKIFVSGDVQIVGLDESVQIVKIVETNQLDVATKTSVSTDKKKVGKKLLKKAIAKPAKPKTIKPSKKVTEFISNTNSSQNIVYSKSKELAVSTIPTNTLMLGYLTFHYKELNIPIYIHLEKIYTEEISLLSSFSPFYFSRPPPSSIA